MSLILLAALLPALADEVKPAWAGVFPDLGAMYSAAYDKPVVAKGDAPKSYSQKATYTWTGGRIEEIAVTFSRDPAIKARYTDAALKKEKAPPKALTINKKSAWRWEGTDSRRLVVRLADDKAVILEQKGDGADLEAIAKKLDFAKIEKALAAAPKR